MYAIVKAATPQKRAAVEFGAMIYGLDVEQNDALTCTLFYQDAEKATRILAQYPADIVKVGH